MSAIMPAGVRDPSDRVSVRGAGWRHEFIRRVCAFPEPSPRIANDEQRSAQVQRVNFVVKLLRAHGGCLGRRRR